MKGNIAGPEDFLPYHAIFLWDDRGKLKEHLRDAIYMQPYFSHLVLEDGSFCTIYWNDTIGYWCGDLWVFGKGDADTYICDSPEEMLDEILADYVDRWENWR